MEENGIKLSAENLRSWFVRDIYYAKYYGQGGGMAVGEKIENEVLGGRKFHKKGGKCLRNAFLGL